MFTKNPSQHPLAKGKSVWGVCKHVSMHVYSSTSTYVCQFVVLSIDIICIVCVVAIASLSTARPLQSYTQSYINTYYIYIIYSHTYILMKLTQWLMEYAVCTGLCHSVWALFVLISHMCFSSKYVCISVCLRAFGTYETELLAQTVFSLWGK